VKVIAAVGLIIGLLWTPTAAHAFDADLFRVRLMQPDDGTPREDPALAVDSNFWVYDETVDAAQRAVANRAAKLFLDTQFETLAEGTLLESVARLRHTDIRLGTTTPRAAEPGAAEDTAPMDVSLRVSERMRLRVSQGEFSRDLLYDPLRERLWVDLYQTDLPSVGAGLTLTNTYRFESGSADLLLKLNRPFD